MFSVAFIRNVVFFGLMSHQANKLADLSLDHLELEELRKVAAQLQAQVKRQQVEQDKERANRERLQHDLENLKGKVDELLRCQHRQAGPFSRKVRKAPPRPDKQLTMLTDQDGQDKRPTTSGRRGGHQGQYRQRPSAPVNQHLEVPLAGCPHCSNNDLHHRRALDQIIEELPEVQPQIIALRTYEGYCDCCAKQVRSTHPLQVSTAQGAASIHLGPRALTELVNLRHRLGLSCRKTAQQFTRSTGIKISSGGVALAYQRLAGKLKADYEALLERINQGRSAHVDETGWYVDGRAWLWVVCNRLGTVFHVAQRRTRQVAEALLADFDGVLISDCLNIYDAWKGPQQKCYAHHLRYLRECMDVRPNSLILPQLRQLLLDALDLGRQNQAGNLSPPVYEQRREELDQRADKLLRVKKGKRKKLVVVHPPHGDYGSLERKSILRLARQRDHLFTFLDEPQVDATNNFAERQLRPAVIQRKLSCGNRTWRGADTWQTLKSLLVSDDDAERDFGARLQRALQTALV